MTADPDQTARLPITALAVARWLTRPEDPAALAETQNRPGAGTPDRLLINTPLGEVMSNPDRTGRTRPYTAPEVLRAVARALSAPRPGAAPLPTPVDLAGLHLPVPSLALNTGCTAGVRAWADALDEPVIFLTGPARGAGVHIRVVGRIRGRRCPEIAVHDTAYDLPLDAHLAAYAQREITLAELQELADAAAPIAAETRALVGAR